MSELVEFNEDEVPVVVEQSSETGTWQQVIPRGPGGRPTKYTAESIETAFQLAAGGATVKQIAAHFNVCIGTLYVWGKAHPEFLKAIKLGREAMDDAVEASLFHRAVGYEAPALHISVNKDGEVTMVP